MREAHHGLGGADRPDAVAVGETRGDVIHNGQQLVVVRLELAPGQPQRQRQTPDLRVTHSLITAACGCAALTATPIG
jgi:hypothetical protein